MPRYITEDVCEELMLFLYDIGYCDSRPFDELKPVYRRLFDIVDRANRRAVERNWEIFKIIAFDAHHEAMARKTAGIYDRIRRQFDCRQ